MQITKVQMMTATIFIYLVFGLTSFVVGVWLYQSSNEMKRCIEKRNETILLLIDLASADAIFLSLAFVANAVCFLCKLTQYDVK